MRGRINSDLYSGIALNATTDQFEVASGNSIMAGDFVQYKYASAERKYLNNSYNDFQFYNITGSYYITNTGVLYKVVSEDLIEKDALPYQVLYGDKIDENYWVFSTSDRLVFIEVDVVNDRINILDEFLVNMSFVGIAVMPNDKLICFTTTNAYVYSIEDIGDVQLLNTVDLGINNGSSYVGHNDTAILYLKFGTYQSGSNSQTRIQQLDFDNENNSLTLYNGPMIYSNGSTSGLRIGQFNINSGAYDGRFQLIILISTYSSGRDFGMYIWDMQNKVGRREAITNKMVHDATYQSKCATSEFIDNEFYLSSVASKLGISKCKITSSGEVEVVGSLCLLNDAYLVKHPINMEDKFLLLTSNSSANLQETYYYNGKNISGDLIIGEQTDYVESYDGVNPRMLMGVAKTSGSSGNIIDVYIPLANT